VHIRHLPQAIWAALLALDVVELLEGPANGPLVSQSNVLIGRSARALAGGDPKAALRIQEGWKQTYPAAAPAGVRVCAYEEVAAIRDQARARLA
jgi:hypothetical protein